MLSASTFGLQTVPTEAISISRIPQCFIPSRLATDNNSSQLQEEPPTGIAIAEGATLTKSQAAANTSHLKMTSRLINMWRSLILILVSGLAT